MHLLLFCPSATSAFYFEKSRVFTFFLWGRYSFLIDWPLDPNFLGAPFGFKVFLFDMKNNNQAS